MSATPLEGIRVIECAQYQSGPVACAILGDLGADVIKIEERVGGDPTRGIQRVSGTITMGSGRHAIWEHHNRNKRSIALDLKNPQAREVLYQLVDKADVFLHNYLPRAVEKLGIGEDILRKRNPRLIYAVTTGYGPKGPDAGSPAFDATGLARSGLMTMVGEPGSPPQNITGGLGDQSGAVFTAFGVLGALLVRERTGVAQRVDGSLLGGLMYLQGVNVALKLIDGHAVPLTQRTKPGSPLWNFYPCADDKWIYVCHFQADRMWPIFCRALGVEHLLDDARFNSIAGRVEHGQELITVIDAAFRRKSRAEWQAVLREADIPHACVNDFDDLIVDQAALANDYIVEYEHPSWGKIQNIGFPATFSQTPCKIRMSSPEHGQHTEEVLHEVLGYDWDQITRLREAAAIL